MKDRAAVITRMIRAAIMESVNRVAAGDPEAVTIGVEQIQEIIRAEKEEARLGAAEAGSLSNAPLAAAYSTGRPGRGVRPRKPHDTVGSIPTRSTKPTTQPAKER
jgi:hypothetical protein